MGRPSFFQSPLARRTPVGQGLSGALSGGLCGALSGSLYAALDAWHPLGAPWHAQLVNQLKDQLGQRVRAMTGATGDARDFLQSARDPGLFGPESVTCVRRP